MLTYIHTLFQYRRNLHATNNDDNQRQTPISAKDYVESLHQNNRVTLLYGKNNVLVLPVFELLSILILKLIDSCPKYLKNLLFSEGCN